MPRLIATKPVHAAFINSDNEIEAGIELPVGGILKFKSIREVEGFKQVFMVDNGRCVHVLTGEMTITE